MTSAELKVIKLPEVVTIKDLAQRLTVSVSKVLAELLKNGITLGMNERIDFETAAIIADDLGFKVELAKEQVDLKSQKELSQKLEQQEQKKLKPRPPVVVVMGHVDHGKTKLLDAIRETNVVDKEAGGITQHIGAYQVKKGKGSITFIDTPGHEAFTAIRSRGANVADIAILVVAADEGIMLQTKESIEIIKKSGLALIVAINKIDKPGADINRVKTQLAELGLTPEDWGGKTICLPISAKKRQGLNELLEMILLVTEMEKQQIAANPDRLALGTIIEAHVDQGEGPVATVLIQAGTLRVGDKVIVGRIYGKVKALKDFLGENIVTAPPSTPARILGLKGLPEVGDILEATVETKEIKRTRKKKISKQEVIIQSIKPRIRIPAKVNKKDGSKETETEIKKKTLEIVLRADTLGSLEAIINSLDKIEHPEVGCEVIFKSLGNITEKDVALADSAKALLLGFNVQPTMAAQEVARGREKEVLTFKIIYELLEAVRLHLEALLATTKIKEVIGQLKVLAIFRTEANQMIIGGQVINGKVIKGSSFDILRQQKKVGQGKISQLQQNKKDIAEVTRGFECGIRFKGDIVVQVNDILEFYTQREEKQRL